jgi:class 3 adenylate cyclase
MRTPARVLVVDDVADNVEILRMRLTSLGYEVIVAEDGEQAMAKAREALPDLILLDIMMPKIDGLEVVRRLKADKSLPFIPVILVTAKASPKDVVAGLDAGGDDYLAKPIDHGALVARVRAMLRIKALHDEVQALNQELEAKVRDQVEELGRIGRLRRFLAPQLAQAIVSAGDEKVLENHRREVVALFCDLRGFTGFSETAEPEDLMTVLKEYLSAVGPLIHKYEGTLDRFTGDGMMVFFNDPLPCEDAPERAARLAIEMRDAGAALAGAWARRGHKLGLGIGIAQGYATLGRIGFEGRFDYTAIGAVINLASRLCSEAADGEVLVSGRLATAIEAVADVEQIGERMLKGMARPSAVARLHGLGAGRLSSPSALETGPGKTKF